MVSTSTTPFRLCTATRRYVLLRNGIYVPANEEDESELSALTPEPPDMYWVNRGKNTTNLSERMHDNTYQCTAIDGKACM